MAREITIAEVDQAASAHVEAKAKADPKKPATLRAKAETGRALVALRQAFRLQEEAAGRRVGMVGGDAEGG